MRWYVPFNGLIFLRCRGVDQQKPKNRAFTNRQPKKKKKTSSQKPSSRRRLMRKRKIVAEHSFVGVTSGDIDSEDSWRIKDITDIHRPMAWVKRESSRFIGHIGPYSRYNVPYLDRLGKRTGDTLYTWYTTLQSFCASYVATIVSRLNRIIDRTKLKSNVKTGLRKLCVRISALAFISGKNYIIDRFQALLRKRGCQRILNSMIRKFISKLDDNKWFVYRHISSQIQWIDLRGGNSRPRDKSKITASTLLLANKLGRSSLDATMIAVYRTLHQISLETGVYAL